MTLVVGVDEAGYGPNLGPLCIGVSAWEVITARPQADIDLFKLLKRAVANGPCEKRLPVADSKLLYKPGGGVEALECGVLAMMALLDQAPASCWETLVDGLAADGEGCRHQLPWHANGYNAAVPRDTCPDRLSSMQSFVRSKLPENVALRAIGGRMVFPAEFNGGCREHASKGRALSCWTLALVRETIDRFTPAASPRSPASILITCDKHGGRNSYAGLVSEFFPEYSLRVVVESRPRSAYLLTRDGVEIRIEFRSKGESQLEAALASMVAKYLRELSMHAFNAYWQSHVPNLKPTAGYPGDAKRFKRDIESKQRDLAISDDILWRVK